MSIVIIGGNDRMHQQYKDICKNCGCRAKVFTQMCSGIRSQIGEPDLMILFTNTVSHKMIHCALLEAQRKQITVERCHSSSASALKNIMHKYDCSAHGTPAQAMG